MTNKLRIIVADIVPRELPRPDADKHFAELVRLIETLGGMTVVKVIQKRGRPSGKTYLGTGKASEIGEAAKELKCDAVVVNGILRGNQIYELTQRIPVLVWDRVDVILRIFEKHATTTEAKLQVKRARLSYDIPKIYRRAATTLFERERGGGVVQRGAGETGIEAEKRHILREIKAIDQKIERLKTLRENQRANRRRRNLLTVALVGYTNSGKSTLLRAMTRKRNVLVADKLFATLDPRLGSLWLPQLRRKVLLADTIGFIENLPPDLVAAFRATLEEVQEADLLLHVFDASDSKSEIIRKQKVVCEILKDLQADQIPQILVANKIDLRNFRRPGIKVSAVTGENLERLTAKIEKQLL
ncbi:MAG: GTPase HflX [Candidatus Peribacteraceae bacterium]|nr:GTPase HflX [Candidatus Peribacteraceae bacterium]